jgi:outer membrane protein TolC
VLTIAECVDRALSFTPSVEIAAAGSDLNEAQARELGGSLLPGLRAETEYSQSPGYQQVITNRGLSRGQLMLDFLLFDGGRRLAQLRAARYRFQSAIFGASAARWQVVFDTEVAYFDMLRARAVEFEQARSLVRIDRFVRTLRALNRSGRATANDVLKIGLLQSQAQIDLQKAHADRQRASIVLGSLIGDYGQDELLVAAAPLLPFPGETDLARNPNLEAARYETNATALDLEAARDEKKPTVRISLTAGALGIDFVKTFLHFRGASYGGVISLPIFDGGAIDARIDQAKARERQASAQVRKIAVDLTQQFSQAKVKYHDAVRQAELLARSRGTADDAFALAWARFLGGGTITLFEVLDTYQQAQKVRFDRLDQEFAANQAAASAALALGTSP